jgi:hypothetical protein
MRFTFTGVFWNNSVELRALVFPSDELKSCLKRRGASLYQLNDKDELWK